MVVPRFPVTHYSIPARRALQVEPQRGGVAAELGLVRRGYGSRAHAVGYRCAMARSSRRRRPNQTRLASGDTALGLVIFAVIGFALLALAGWLHWRETGFDRGAKTATAEVLGIEVRNRVGSQNTGARYARIAFETAEGERVEVTEGPVNVKDASDGELQVRYDPDEPEEVRFVSAGAYWLPAAVAAAAAAFVLIGTLVRIGQAVRAERRRATSDET